VEIGIKKLHPDAKLPTRQTAGSVGADLYSYENRLLGVGEVLAIRTGIAIELPPGYEAQIRPRSGMAAKSKVIGIFGTIDADFKDELMVILRNVSINFYEVKKFDRIAQLVIVPALYPSFHEIEELSTTERKGGLGSTGR
jgi:dUTP pyrophosphatase